MATVVYLAGGMRNGPTRDRIKAALRALGVVTLDPNHWADECKNDPQLYTNRDIEEIRKCDFVVAFMTRDNPSGYGLNFEIGYAVGIEKPVLFLNLLGNDARQRYFGMASVSARTHNLLHPFLDNLRDWVKGGS